jgi:hypothetical protein
VGLLITTLDGDEIEGLELLVGLGVEAIRPPVLLCTRRLGSIVAGPIIAIGSLTALGQRGIFLTSAALTLIGLLIIAIASRTNKAVENDRAKHKKPIPQTEA